MAEESWHTDNARYRRALERIADQAPVYTNEPGHFAGVIARLALEGREAAEVPGHESATI